MFDGVGVHVHGAGIVVVLNGLSINGQGGNDGILYSVGARLYIERCTISNMTGRGVNLYTGETYITDSTIRDNIDVGVAAESIVTLVVDRSRIERNAGTGLQVLNGAKVTVTNSTIAGNIGLGGIAVESHDSNETLVAVTDSSISNNWNQGIIAATYVANSTLRFAVASSTLAGNGATAVYAQGWPER